VRECTIPLEGEICAAIEDLASRLRRLDEETGVIGDRHCRRPREDPARTALTLISTCEIARCLRETIYPLLVIRCYVLALIVEPVEFSGGRSIRKYAQLSAYYLHE